jgi:hypothetical protein
MVSPLPYQLFSFSIFKVSLEKALYYHYLYKLSFEDGVKPFWTQGIQSELLFCRTINCLAYD